MSVRVRGAATPEELAAVLAAVLATQSSAVEPDAYARWRAGRRAAVRDRAGTSPRR